MKKVFAICDTEKEYSERFMEYINLCCSLPFEIQVFSDPQELAAYGRKHPIEILLINARAVSDDILELPVSTCILLRDGEEDDSKGQKEEPAVYKYQPARQIVREVMTLYSAEREAAPSVGKKDVRRIGVISPADPGMKTMAGILLGQIFGESEATLYCNLEPYSGLPGLVGKKERTLSDLLYFFRQGKDGLIYSLNSMTERVQGLDVIPPVENPEDLLELSGEEWTVFFDEILRTGVYENLVLDIGCGIRDLDEVLAYCDVVYLPQGQDKMARAADAVFCQWLSDTGFSEEKLKKIQLEASPSGAEGRVFFERQLQGKNGQIIRDLVYEEKRKNGYSGYAQASHGETGGQRRAG